MSKPKSLIGTELDSTTRTIELSQLRNITLATNFDLNIHVSQTTLPSFLYGNLINTANIYRNLGLNFKNVLLSRESVLLGRFLTIGDTVTIRTFLKDAYEQQATSNPIGFIILESVGQVNHETAFYAERILAVRGGFARGR